jgi:hypothetical protein
MAKRFTATEIWEEDWFLAMPNEYKLFWFYILSNCDHAGFFKVNLRSFCGLLGVKIAQDKALAYFNSGKDRIKVVNEGVWLIEDFFVFQYGHTLNLNSPLHQGVEKQYIKYNLKLTSIRGLKDLKDRVKDKDSIISNKVNTDLEKKEGVGERKTFNQFPKPENFNGLPELNVNQAIQLLDITKKTKLTPEDVQGLWNVFKTKNLTGTQFYQEESKVYSHFIDSLKYQNFTDGTHQSSPSKGDKPGTSEARINKARKW